MTTLNPYLVFKDNCEEAFHFYEMVFKGNILYMGRYKDVPNADRRYFPLSSDEKIMHATLQIDAKSTLMGCDSIENHRDPAPLSIPNFYLYMSTDNQEEAYRIFSELSAGGKITMPIAQTFWTDHYGMLTDKFGIHWKITFNPDKK